MILTKNLLLIIMLFIKYTYGGKGCTISDILLEQFERGEYGFYPGQHLMKANSSELRQFRHYTVTRLAYYGYCLGFSTETLDTIVLDCPEKDTKNSGCFQILTPQFNTQNNTIFFTEKEKRICVSKLDESCVGLNINKEIAIILNCHVYSYMGNAPRSGIPSSFAGSAPINGKPPRY